MTSDSELGNIFFVSSPGIYTTVVQIGPEFSTIENGVKVEHNRHIM